MIGRHAVVLGAGFAGLLAARVLAGAYERVTLIERDEPAGPDAAAEAKGPTGPRHGVPHAAHAHTLLSRGDRDR